MDKEFTEELTKPSIDLSVDYSEIFIDDIIDNEFLKDIPIVKTIVGAVNVGRSINQLWFAKKILTFIKEFNSGDIKTEKLTEFKEKLAKEPKFRQRMTEQVMIFNERFIEITKSKISAQLLVSYVNQEISYDEFISLNISLDRLHPDSYTFLKTLAETEYKVDEEKKGEKNFDAQSLLLSSGLARETSSWSHGFEVKPEGIKLFEHGIKKIKN
ncbi:MAG: hypothetical protein ABJR05_05015 [Balneola sp.]